VYVGLLMGSMFSQVGKMISFPSGLLPNRPLLPDVKDTNHGSQLYALIHGDVTIETIDLAVWVKTVGSYYGISA
jgi:hypothetical protein